MPLVTRGKALADDDPANDINYFLGLIPDPAGTAGLVFAADFESEPNGISHGLHGSRVITDARWHHVAATLNGSSWRLYVDGTGEAEASGAVANDEAQARLAIGAAFDTTTGPDGGFDGWIDELRIWKRARSSAEIAGSYDRVVDVDTDLVARWSFDEGGGAAVRDDRTQTATQIVGTFQWGPGSAGLASAAPRQ